uniref:Protein MCM10 homolog n=1 Tax=Saccoglossus kowalevskii TaxID=10224 RepID=A0ABM0MFP6_SACKO|nr:PREDICTED: protein MCM10 homolog [Saccoglossus kowalevskii]
MLLGKSKDLGWCKGRRKDGRDCTMFVNKTECEFCQYHVQSAYKKMSSKRTDLQASYVGPQPRAFKEQMMWLINYCIYVHIMPFSHHDRYVGPQPRAFKEQMKKGTIFYGGQTYTSQSSSGKKVKKETKTLKNLDLSKAKQLQEADKMNMLKIHRLSTTESAEFIGVANGNEQFQERLVVPTVGSQNLLKHMKTTEETEKVKNGLIESVSASDLIKIHKKDLLERKRAQKRKLSAVTSPNVPLPPMLGRGVGDDQQVFLDFSPPSKSSAKSRATAFWKSKGPASRDDPNAVGKKITPDKVTQINKRVERDRRLSQDESPPSEQPRKKKKFLGTDLSEIDKHSEEFQNMVKAKSKHSELVHEVEADLQEKYFQELEKKEKLETRATSIMEKVCKVVSCKQCQYTYFSPSERCKKENHSLKWHETKQRYYQCKKCKTRMFTFNMLPTGSCRNCGNTQFERTGMMSERKVPKLESETLLLRGEELKYVST